jgi:hypothetical protein
MMTFELSPRVLLKTTLEGMVFAMPELASIDDASMDRDIDRFVEAMSNLEVDSLNIADMQVVKICFGMFIRGYTLALQAVMDKVEVTLQNISIDADKVPSGSAAVDIGST